ncbi:Y-family DNA polymerase [Flavobacterium hauense]
MYALVDCNNFFASCEIAFDPKLYGKPVGVLSNNDGNIVARSPELKELGVKMGTPPFQIRELLSTYQVDLLSSNYELYGDTSQRVFNTLCRFSPETERYSVDEVFQKYFGFKYASHKVLGADIRNAVMQEQNIPVCVGFAPTKSLAKIANKIAKKYPYLNGVCVIDTQEKLDTALKMTKTEDIWGIGRAHTKRLDKLGIVTAYDFVHKLPVEWVRKNMTVVGVRMQRDLSGEQAIFFEDIKPKKHIISSKSFAKNTNDLTYILERAASYAYTAAEKLRKDNSHCKEVFVQVQTNWFREDRPQDFEGISITLDYPTDSAIQICKAATDALRRIHKEGYLYKKVVVGLSRITPAGTPQLALFRNEKPGESQLMKVMDTINKRQGKHSVMLGSMDPKEPIKMKRGNLSKRASTKWDELIEINCTK